MHGDDPINVGSCFGRFSFSIRKLVCTDDKLKKNASPKKLRHTSDFETVLTEYRKESSNSGA